MSFVLSVDADRWRTHLEAVCAAAGRDLVPVIKGNGYGLGQVALAAEADRLGCRTLAVGTVHETREILGATTGDVIVLEPFEPRDAAANVAWERILSCPDSARLVRTVSSAAALRSLAEASGSARVLIEARTSMHRFGMDERELLGVLADTVVRDAIAHGRLEVLGLSLHLPMAQPADEVAIRGVDAGSARVREVARWAGIWRAEADSLASLAATLWVSHCSDDELAEVGRLAPRVALRPRIGTRLWLGDRGSLAAAGTVLAVHPLPHGTHVGYRQRTGPRDGTLVVVSGGTAHGIGLSAPSPAGSVRQRVVTAGTGALDAAGRSLSPFTWAGSRRWFAEPPHQHHSMVWLPKGCVVPSVGDALAADVRFTTSRFDAVQGLA